MKPDYDDMPTTDWWLTECVVTQWLLAVETWPRWVRRTYIVSAPISIPAHLILVAIAACGIFLTLPIDLVLLARRLWRE